AITRSHELGVNLVDTAEAYGNGHSEQVVGRALRDIGRDEFVVATKVHGANLRYDELQRAAAASMKRLGVNEIDLYQVHWPDPWEQIPLKETMKALEKLYTEGKIRAIGVSNFAVRDLEEARSYLSRTDIVSNQVRYNFLERSSIRGERRRDQASAYQPGTHRAGYSLRTCRYRLSANRSRRTN